MVDRLLRMHIQSQRACGPRWTLSYNMVSVIVAGSVCVHENPGNLALANVVSDRCIAAPVAALALADRWCSRLSKIVTCVMLLTRERIRSTGHTGIL